MVQSVYVELNSKDWLYNKFIIELLSVADIAKLLSCHRSSVNRALKRFGLYNYRLRTKWPLLNNREWLQNELRTKSYRQIASDLGTTSGNIGDRVRRHGINHFSSNKESLSGEKANHWKGGRRRINGYWMIYAPDHPNATLAKTVMEHRLVMEKKIGRYLRKEEIIHHINGIKDDNRIENLEIHTRSEHTRIHFDKGDEVARLKRLLEANNIPY